MNNRPVPMPSPVPQAPAGAVVGETMKIDLQIEVRTACTVAGKLVSEMVQSGELPQQLSIEAFRAAVGYFLEPTRAMIIADIQINAQKANMLKQGIIPK